MQDSGTLPRLNGKFFMPSSSDLGLAWNTVYTCHPDSEIDVEGVAYCLISSRRS